MTHVSGRCGNSKKHTTCPAISGVSCDNCGKKNHYARVCFGKTKHNIDNRNQKQRLGMVVINIVQIRRTFEINEIIAVMTSARRAKPDAQDTLAKTVVRTAQVTTNVS
jgi:hypothetical protein